MVRDPNTGKHRRTRLFVMTLGDSGMSVRPLRFKSSSRIWTDCSIMVTSSNADHGVGRPQRACPAPSRRGKTTTVPGHPIGRVCGVH